MKTKENQQVKTGNILGVIALVLILLIMICLPWGGYFHESKVLRARSKAEVLGYQLAQIYQENLKKTTESLKTSRSIASDSEMVEFKPEGLMGIDPWGQPYKYIIQQVGSEQLRVLIWSMGPNQKDDSDVADMQKNVSAAKSDDVQIVLNIPVNDSASVHQ
jgi:hypothetical protein